MKKIFLLLGVVFCVLSQAQEMNTIYVDGSLSTGPNIGLMWESSSPWMAPENNNISTLFKGKYSNNTLTNSNPNFRDVDGSGWLFEVGIRYYFKKNNNYKGFYLGSGFGTASLEFESDNYYNTYIISGDGKFFGEYRYFYIPLELGYKFLIAQKVAVNIYAGSDFKMERSPKGDFSNSSSDNIVPRIGLAVGYKF